MADPAELIARGLKSAVHYMQNCGVDIERDFPEVDAALAALHPQAPASIASAEAVAVLDKFCNDCVSLHLLNKADKHERYLEKRAAVLARMDRRAVIEECARVAEAQTASCDLDTPGGHGCDYFVRNTVVPAIRALADKETGK